MNKWEPGTLMDVFSKLEDAELFNLDIDTVAPRDLLVQCEEWARRNGQEELFSETYQKWRTIKDMKRACVLTMETFGVYFTWSK